MTVVHPNHIVGINSITVQTGDSLSVHKADGSLIRTIVSNTGVSTFHAIEVSKGGGDLTVGVSTLFADNSTGRIGIGTVTPTSLLTVGAKPKTTSAAATVLISPASGNASIQLRGGSPTLEFDGTGGGNGQIFTDSADLTISNGTLDGAGSERLRITSDGNITFGVATGNTAVTSGSIKYIGCGGDYWNSTKGDYRALRLRVYDNGIDDQYGIGISNSELEIQSQSAIGVYAGTDGGGTGRRRKRITINSAGGVAINNTDTNAVHSMSNIDHGNLEYNHRNGRVLHSNGTGWDGNESNDGSDPILILGVTDRAGNSDIGDAYGLCLHSDSQDNNDYGPLIGWSNRSNSGAYNTTYAAIVGQKTGTGADNNWSSGALHFFTQKPGSYMDSTADLTIDQAGHVMMPRNSRFYALNNSGGSDSGDGSTGKISDMFETELVDSNGDYNTSNGRFTAPVDGKYEFHFAALHRSLGSAGSGELTFYKNGSNLSSRSFGYSNIGSGGSTSDHQHLHIHGIFSLSAGDYVDVRIYAQSSGMDFYFYQGLGYFSGKLLG